MDEPSSEEKSRMNKKEVKKIAKELKNVDIKRGGTESDKIAGEKERKVTRETAVREKGVIAEGFWMIDRKVSKWEVKEKEGGRYKRVTVDEAIQTDPEKQDRGSQTVEDGQPVVKIEKSSMTPSMLKLPLPTLQYHNPVTRGHHVLNKVSFCLEIQRSTAVSGDFSQHTELKPEKNNGTTPFRLVLLSNPHMLRRTRAKSARSRRDASPLPSLPYRERQPARPPVAPIKSRYLGDALEPHLRRALRFFESVLIEPGWMEASLSNPPPTLRAEERLHRDPNPAHPWRRPIAGAPLLGKKHR
ncbi:hypothetical protein JRQ81_006531 [Phrynocephalus forsythii]|uniref:Uncharacterized protein n=1 Tax=Phrynocephalus forsythii TaxID=171643 RepID=A0A9Q0Y3H2_9SAUR|nr:hypothetical protein JRQ81_006531 [Phrynocephalus forsythii]